MISLYTCFNSNYWYLQTNAHHTGSWKPMGAFKKTGSREPWREQTVWCQVAMYFQSKWISLFQYLKQVPSSSSIFLNLTIQPKCEITCKVSMPCNIASSMIAEFMTCFELQFTDNDRFSLETFNTGYLIGFEVLLCKVLYPLMTIYIAS